MRLKITETMRGSHHFVDPDRGDAVDRPFHFRIDWGGTPLEVLNPVSSMFLVFEATGVILVAGLTKGEVPCHGVLTLDYFTTKSLRYELDFEIEGERYYYVGKKVDVDLKKPLFLIKTHTTCYGTLSRGDGTIISRSVSHFEPEKFLPFIKSIRLKL